MQAIIQAVRSILRAMRIVTSSVVQPVLKAGKWSLETVLKTSVVAVEAVGAVATAPFRALGAGIGVGVADRMSAKQKNSVAAAGKADEAKKAVEAAAGPAPKREPSAQELEARQINLFRRAARARAEGHPVDKFEGFLDTDRLSMIKSLDTSTLDRLAKSGDDEIRRMFEIAKEAAAANPFASKPMQAFQNTAPADQAFARRMAEVRSRGSRGRNADPVAELNAAIRRMHIADLARGTVIPGRPDGLSPSNDDGSGYVGPRMH